MEDTANGAVKSDHTRASKGTTVTLTVTPNEGYGIGGVTVTSRDGKEITVTSGGSGKYAFTMPAGKVPVSEYAISAMRWACDSGIIGGYEDGTLNPTGKATHAMVATIMMRYHKTTLK